MTSGRVATMVTSTEKKRLTPEGLALFFLFNRRGKHMANYLLFGPHASGNRSHNLT